MKFFGNSTLIKWFEAEQRNKGNTLIYEHHQLRNTVLHLLKYNIVKIPMGLPKAKNAAGLTFSLGQRTKGCPVPVQGDIHIIHYRFPTIGQEIDYFACTRRENDLSQVVFQIQIRINLHLFCPPRFALTTN